MVELRRLTSVRPRRRPGPHQCQRHNTQVPFQLFFFLFSSHHFPFLSLHFYLHLSLFSRSLQSLKISSSHSLLLLLPAVVILRSLARSRPVSHLLIKLLPPLQPPSTSHLLIKPLNLLLPFQPLNPSCPPPFNPATHILFTLICQSCLAQPK